jgi:hypothetical protein
MVTKCVALELLGECGMISGAGLKFAIGTRCISELSQRKDYTSIICQKLNPKGGSRV